MKSAIYLRQSQDRSGEELGITRQGDDARKLAKHRGWDIVEEFVDNDLSAAGKRLRPAFEALLKAVEDERVQCVIAWDMTRLTRNARDRLRILEAGKKHGLIVAFVRGSDIDLGTPAGRLTADILGSVAQHEIEQKSDRQRRAARQAAEQGKWIGGRRPFGYQADGMTIREDEAEAVRQGYEALLSGVPLGRIAADWNARGLWTPQRPYAHGCDGNCQPNVRARSCPQAIMSDEPSRWTGQTLLQFLLNPRNAGLRSHVTEAARAATNPRKARIQGIVGAAAWPGIVSEETYRAAVAVLTDPSRLRQGSLRKRLLTGVALCGVCDGPMHAGGSAGGKPGYRCATSNGHVTRRSEPIDEYVEEVTIQRLSRPDAKLLLRDDEPEDTAALREEMRTLRARLDEQAALHAAGDIDTAQLRAGSALLRRRLQEAEKCLAEAGRVSILAPLVGSDDLRAAWTGMDTDRRRAVIDKLFIIKLLPPGRGRRAFQPETVVIEQRRF